VGDGERVKQWPPYGGRLNYRIKISAAAQTRQGIFASLQEQASPLHSIINFLSPYG
jgi:hypothetical protein